jgi:N-acetylglucosaminyl-diphospho-decaprenol L-rhamnosyltransferase
MILKGKATLLHKHWRSPRRQVGLTLLLLGAGSRALVARLAGRRAGARLDAWRDVWRQRGSWLPGYPEAEPRPRALEAAAS